MRRTLYFFVTEEMCIIFNNWFEKNLGKNFLWLTKMFISFIVIFDRVTIVKFLNQKN